MCTGKQVQFSFYLLNRQPQTLLRWIGLLKFAGKRERGVESVKGEFFSGEDLTLFTPTRVSLENLRMSQPCACVRKNSSNHRGTRDSLASKPLHDCILNQTERRRAHHILLNQIPNLNNELFSG